MNLSHAWFPNRRLRELEADQADSPLACTSHRASPDGDREGAREGEEEEDKAIHTRRVASDGADGGGSTGCQQARLELIACAELSFGMLSRVLTAVAAATSAHPTTTTAVTPTTTTSAEAASLRVRFHIIRNARIDNVGKSRSCMVSKVRIIWKQTVDQQYLK